ncbi:MAG: peroxiredoxin family protein [Bacteroidales bacterium]|nr:peroxiredoxin family protein [Bacteroidales bacterium]MCL2132727.1 peroxiredoxin family protein [Bacteroidales bacterium]
MKKVFLFSVIFIFGQTLFAQINLDTLFQNFVIDSYKKYDNYTAEIVTNSTIRGKHTKDRGVIDTTYNTKDTTLIYCENNKFVGAQTKNTISYTEDETNTTLNLVRKFIAVNSLQDYWGKYFNDVSIRGETHFYTSIIGYPKFFKKMDKISDMGDYFVFECVDSSLIVNDIKMYEDVKMYVNQDNYLLEKITTKRQNNTIAELDLGAIEREIVINYLEFNQPNSIYKAIFNTIFYPDFPVVKNDNPYIAINKKAFDKREQQVEKFEKSKITLSKEVLGCEIVSFENNSIKLNDIKGWLLLDIWHQSCFPCFEMMKEVALNQQKFEERGITIVSLNSYEQPSDYLKAFCKKMKIDISDLYFFKNEDDIITFKKQFRIFPSMFLISPNKKVVWHTVGKKSITELLQEIDKFIKITKQ